MTISLNRTVAGTPAPRRRSISASAAAVWEPSGFREAAAEHRVVRTLRVADRMERRGDSAVGVRTNPESLGKVSSRRRRGLQTLGTYLLGAVFGVCVVTAALSQSEVDSTPGSFDMGATYTATTGAVSR